ncbi:MAG: hypothetical protein AAF573_21445 [Bacteroidota bacterium]
MKNLLGMLLCLLPLLSISQQEIHSLWEKSYLPKGKKSSEKVHDAIWLPDGNIALVGEVANKRTQRDGLIIIINSENGEVLDRMELANFGDEALKAVVYGDYSLYAVGYTNKGLIDGKNGWLVELNWQDESLSLLRDTVLGSNLEDEFLEIVWTDNSTALIGGVSGTYDDSAWLLNWNGKKVAYETTIAKGISKNLVGMEKGNDGRIWVCGNTYSKRTEGNIWWVEVDQYGKEYGLDLLGDDVGEVLHHSNRSVRGDLLLAGETWESNVDQDAWMHQLKFNRKDKVLGKYNQKEDERATTLLEAPEGIYWMTIRSTPKGFGNFYPKTLLLLWNELTAEDPFLKKELVFSKKSEFVAVHFLRTPKNEYVLVGNLTRGKKRKKSQIHLKAWDRKSLLLAKGFVELQHRNVQVVDQDGDGYISAHEKGAIKFSIKNLGDGDFEGGEIQVIELSKVVGLTVTQKKQYINYLPKGSEDFYSVPLIGKANLREGEYNFYSEIRFSFPQISFSN